MALKKSTAFLLAFVMLFSLFTVVPSVRAQAMSDDAVVIDAATTPVYSLADTASSALATAKKNSTFLLLEQTSDVYGMTWYKIYYSASVQGWVRADASSYIRVASTVYDEGTTYLRRTARVTASSYTLRKSASTKAEAVVNVSKDDRVVVLDFTTDSGGTTWYEVQFGRVTGWIIRTSVELNNIMKSAPNVNGAERPPVFYLSPSRQPSNPYAAGNTNECAQMTRVSTALKAILEQRYDCVVYHAAYETPINRSGRPYEAYLLGADVYLAIHSNAASGTCYGTQGYYFPGTTQSLRMAENLVSAISAVDPFNGKYDGAKNGMQLAGGAGYGEVRDPAGYGLVSLLLEVEFHDNKDSAQWIIDNTDLLAAAIADGLQRTFNLQPRTLPPYDPGTTTSTTIGELVIPTVSTQPTDPTTTTTTTIVTPSSTSTTSTTTTTTSTTSTTVSTEVVIPTSSSTEPTTSTTATASTTSTTAPTSTTTTAPTSTTTTAPTTAPNRPAMINRAGGSDRVSTAIEVSRMGWQSAETVIIASGLSYPDALAAVPLAGAVDAPILLTADKSGKPEAALLAEIKRLGAHSAYILGGTSAVSAQAEKALTGAGLTVRRLAGADRYATCLEIARELAARTDGSFDTLFFASADNFPDALAVGPAAAVKGDPILYIGAKSELLDSVAAFVGSSGCNKAVVLGGESAVSTKGEKDIKRLCADTERISGADRYATAAAIVARYNGSFNGGAALATGKTFPDALAGGAHAAKLGIPVLLTSGRPSAEVLECAALLGAGELWVYGGMNAVPAETADVILGRVG